MGSFDQGSLGTGMGLISDMGINDLGVTEYYSEEILGNILKRKKSDDITIVHNNISSLPRRITDLQTELSMLKFEPDVIGLSETKITTKVNTYYNPSLPSYNYYQSMSTTNSGSEGVFIKDNLDISIRKDLDITVPGILETVWFDIKDKNRKKCTIGVSYRHPARHC